MRLCYGPRLASSRPGPEPAYFMTCGRGGTGRRAALRSLWPKGRGSSSLLDRTSIQSGEQSLSGRGGRDPHGCDPGGRPWQDRSQTDDRVVTGHLQPDTQVAADLRSSGGIGADPQSVGAIGDALEQEEAVEVGSGSGDKLAA